MKSYQGLYLSSSQAGSVTATILVFENNLSIGFRNPDQSPIMISWALKDITAAYSLAEQTTHITNRQLAGQLIIEGKEAAELVHTLQVEQKKSWFKKSGSKAWIKGMAFLLGILGVLVLLYLLLVPWLSERMASTISIKTEQRFGDAVYEGMELQGKEDKAASLAINDFFSAMQVNSRYNIRISVIKDSIVNAFALPGGRIIVYTALLDRIQSYPELAALLSHEFVHVEEKHATRSVFRKLGSKIFLGLLFGRFGTVTSVLVDQADNLKSLTYSRRLEKEADLKGMEILAQRKIDPQGFVQLMQHLQASSTERQPPEFLNSHPDIESRIAYLQERAKGLTVSDDERLKAIFEKLKW